MPRAAVLIIEGNQFSAEIKKLDRKKVYGWSIIDVTDDQGNLCKLADIADGQHVLPSGSISRSSFDENGEYVSRSLLIGVDKDGKPVEKEPSIFDQSVNLVKTDLDEFLTVNVKGVYQLFLNEGKSELLNLLSKGDIYNFKFNYRTDYEADDAYLVSNSGEVFAVVGKKADIEFLGLENREEIIPDEPDEAVTEEDDFDFAML